MTGVRPGLFWQLTWRLIAPLVIAVILVSSIVKELTGNPVYWPWRDAASEEEAYPAWCLWIAVVLAVSSVLPILIVFLLRALGLNVLPIDEDVRETNEGGEVIKPMIEEHHERLPGTTGD